MKWNPLILIRSAPTNPILVKELRSRMRGWRAFAVLTGMLVLLGGISYLLYRLTLETTRYSNMPVSPQIGRTLFAGLAVVELMVICFITPAITAGAISSEREKLTYEMLLATPLRPGRILWGKLVSALSYVLLLLVAAVPMASLVFIFGGVSLRDMFKTMIVLLAITITLGVIGVFMSAWLRRTIAATVLSYLAVLTLIIGPLIVYVAVGILQQKEPPRWLLVPNPISALFSAITPSAYSGGIDLLGGLSMVLTGNLSGSSSFSSIPRPLYHYTLPLYGTLSLVLYMMATRLVRPTRRWRIHWKRLLIAGVIWVVFCAIVAVPFLLTANRYERMILPPTPTSMVIPVEPEMRPAMPAMATPLPGLSTTLSEEDRTAIYTAAIRQMYTRDHTFEDQFAGFAVVYLLRVTDDGVGDPNAPRGDSQILPESVQQTVVEALSDLPARWVWIDRSVDAPRDEQGVINDNGAIFTLGNIYLNGQGTAFVSALLYFSPLGGGGQTYVLQKNDGTWQVTGKTGVTWIS